jgi:trans-aconitate 2-methyltransferase
MNVWDPNQYAAFGAERARPFFELLGRIPDRPYRRIVDLGCGPGELTRVLADRWPQAEVIGLDNSAEMLADSDKYAIPGRLRFELGDIGSYDTPADLIFSNAALHWLTDHATLVPRLARFVNPGGAFAVQIPGNFHARSHESIMEMIAEPRWASKVTEAPWPDSTMDPGFYVQALWPLGFKVDAWLTEYQQVLQGEDPIVEWVKGTALRPALAQLNASDAAEFEATYRTKMREEYPGTAYGTLYPFKRVFWVATRE